MNLACQLRNVRIKQKKTLRWLAKETGISFQYISDIELGKKDPSVSKLALLAKALNHQIKLVPLKRKIKHF